ncbi:aldose 1-epimerase family protein [Vagococcus silagei]|uniref:Aldose 1-epimerase family protein n=1 Tax=Vagococcus silagei TaxID=2508885 RepID=A0A4S3B5R7_9ENTE|nr:aldose 1-epimerase family protein [Vagococcus silagei]THB61667.1 aldose 1-epimerase family protein [Vagococcus silagei]
MVKLKNEKCEVEISPHGAELTSFKLASSGLEYIWQGEQKYWGRSAPNLFPIVGRLQNDQYKYQGKKYNMSQHGFARDLLFSIVEETDQQVTFLLKSNEETLRNYPFEFDLKVSYELIEASLKVSYVVHSLSEEMYFGIGGHPGFNVPLVENTSFEDYYLSFTPSKSRTMLPLEGPFIDLEHATLAQTNTDIVINREMFEKDALVLRTSGHNTFRILSDATKHGVEVSYRDAPFVGFWSPYMTDAPFVCIEPWWGIADSLEATGNIEDKYGINCLKLNETFEASYTINVF